MVLVGYHIMGVFMRAFTTSALWVFSLVFSLTACGTASDGMQNAGDDPALGGDNGMTEVEGPAPAELAEVTNGVCPDLSQPGRISLTSGGVQRELILVYPAEMTNDMPVIFHWHPLGGSASMISKAATLPFFGWPAMRTSVGEILRQRRERQRCRER